MTGGDTSTSDPLWLWKTALKFVGNAALHPFVLYLPCLQWAVWLATCQFKTIKEFKVKLTFHLTRFEGTASSSFSVQLRLTRWLSFTLCWGPKRCLRSCEMMVLLDSDELQYG